MRRQFVLINAIIFASACICFAAGPEPKIIIKMASLAPKGSNIANYFGEVGKQVREKTNYEVGFKTYWGGVQGDGKDVIRKIKLGQLHGGGFMGPDIGLILPEIRVTEIPYILRNYEEARYVRSRLEPLFEKALEAKGFKVLSWGDLGFVYTFSKNKIDSLDDARKQKWWTLQGEPIGQAMFKALRITPVSLSIVDVATSLSTNMIDCASSTPYGAVAFQWSSKFKYMSSYPSSCILGATLVSKDVWDKISPASQKIIMDISKKENDKLVKIERNEDARALAILKKSGMIITPPPDPNDKDMKYVFDAAKQVREDLVGKLYSKEMLNKTLALIDEYRRYHPNDKTMILAQ